ncbi:MAG: hypothetical protein O2894_05565 [Planctomycetota bacterium]|nr:hypothetical protein [Planctomycetota bacterium]
MRIPTAWLVPTTLVCALVWAVAFPGHVMAEDKPAKVESHADDVVEKAKERFEQDYAADDMDKRLRILKWYGLHMHKDVLKDLSKIYLSEKNVELQAAAAEGLGNQLQDPRRASGYLMQGMNKYEDYGTREDPEGQEEVLNENEARVLATTLASLGKLGEKPDKSEWKLIKGLIDHNHDEVAIAMLNWCGTTQEWRALPMILEWFQFYPDGYSWSGGSVTVDTGAAGNKDANAAKAKYKAKYGGRAAKARPKAHEAMKSALKAITGRDFEKPAELKDWMDENKTLLKKNGV